MPLLQNHTQRHHSSPRETLHSHSLRPTKTSMPVKQRGDGKARSANLNTATEAP